MTTGLHDPHIPAQSRHFPRLSLPSLACLILNVRAQNTLSRITHVWENAFPLSSMPLSHIQSLFVNKTLEIAFQLPSLLPLASTPEMGFSWPGYCFSASPLFDHHSRLVINRYAGDCTSAPNLAWRSHVLQKRGECQNNSKQPGDCIPAPCTVIITTLYAVPRSRSLHSFIHDWFRKVIT